MSKLPDFEGNHHRDNVGIDIAGRRCRHSIHHLCHGRVVLGKELLGARLYCSSGNCRDAKEGAAATAMRMIDRLSGTLSGDVNMGRPA